MAADVEEQSGRFGDLEKLAGDVVFVVEECRPPA